MTHYLFTIYLPQLVDLDGARYLESRSVGSGSAMEILIIPGGITRMYGWMDQPAP